MFRNINLVDFEDMSILISKTVNLPIRRVNSNLSFCFLVDVQEFTSFIAIIFIVVINIMRMRKIYLHSHLMAEIPTSNHYTTLLIYLKSLIQISHLHQYMF